VGVFGGFTFGGDVYGPDVDIVSVELVTDKLIRINLDLPVVVDAAYNDPTNYAVTLTSGDGQLVTVRAVLPTSEDTIQDIILVVDRVSRGATYQVSISNAITSASGQTVTGSGRVTGRRTKAEGMIKSLPVHFNNRPDSLICCILSAIGLQDDTIGGSQDDTFS